MDKLRSQYFKMASIEEIRKSKTRKHGYLALDGKDPSPPKAAWDVNAVELSDSSDDGDGTHD